MKNSAPKISIVLPCYNGQRYLAGSIQSVIDQTEKDWELIIVNDCSTDDTLAIAQSFADKDQRIRVVTNPTNKKLPGSLNAGFALAAGHYLTWTSDDNLYKPQALQVMSDYLDQHPQVDMVHADADFIDDDGKVIGCHSSNGLLPLKTLGLVVGNNINAAFLYRRTIAEKIGKYDDETFCAEDYDYWCRIALAGNIDYSLMKLNIYQYRQSTISLTATQLPRVKAKMKYIQDKYRGAFIEKFGIVSILKMEILYKIGVSKAELSSKDRMLFSLLKLRHKAALLLANILFFWNKSLRRQARNALGISIQTRDP